MLVDITFSSVVRAVAYDERCPGIDSHPPHRIFRDNICCTVTHLCLCCHSFFVLVCGVLEWKQICTGFFSIVYSCNNVIDPHIRKEKDVFVYLSVNCL